MTEDSALKLLDAATKLLAAIAWPTIVAFFLIRFGPAVIKLVESAIEVSLETPGFKIRLKRQEAVNSIVSAAASKPGAGPNIEEATRVVARLASSEAIRRAERATVLWVDDKPGNNFYERKSLSAVGITFVLAISTESALETIKHQCLYIDAIISDMARPDDPQAGLALLRRLRADGNETPFIIYAGSSALRLREESMQAGAYGCTNRPEELFSMVLSSLNRVDGKQTRYLAYQ